jgi:peptidoglycan/LPS O-acetylase OafA/YrhL
MRLAELDYLRGFAAFAVVWFHFFYKGPAEGWMSVSESSFASAGAKYGYLGVHLFFMISGFVISMSAEGASARSFFASRAARLYPAMWVCATLTAIVMTLVPSSPFSASIWQYVANLSLVPHWFSYQPIDGAYWSLVVEVHFYLAVFILILFKQGHRLEQMMYAWLLLSIINFNRPMYPVQLWLNAHWAPLLASGAILYFVRRSGWTVIRAFGLLCCLVLAIAYEASRNVGPNAPNMAVVTIAIAIMFVAFCVIASRSESMSVSKGSAFFSAITYPLYLAHQNIGYAFFNAGKNSTVFANEQFRIYCIIALLVLCAWLIHKWIEKPVGPWLRRTIDGRS